jgi:hypothetical protein
MTALTLYVLAAMLAWTRPHAQPRDDADRAWLGGIAEDIAAVALEEPPLFRGDEQRVKTSLLLASVARFESSFATWVDDGSCNDAAWRRDSLTVHHGATCDSGHAFSLWQVHPFAGPTGQEMIADRRVAIREAIARMRVSLDAGKGLCWYTGETGDCPKAELRLRTALVWEKGHPFEVGVD